MTLFFYDTETTGLYKFKAKPDDPDQPNLVQLAWVMDHEGSGETEEMDLVIYPESWEIPSEATAVHGISTEMAKAKGLSLETALNSFAEAIGRADTIIAHNLNFDMNVMKSVFLRKGIQFPSLERKNKYCTMLSSMNVLKLPAKWGTSYKWPKLDESYRFLVDSKGFEGAHDALNDVRACREVYLKLMERRITN